MKNEQLAQIVEQPTYKIVLLAGSVRLVNWTHDSLVEHAFRGSSGQQRENVIVSSVWRGDFGTVIISARGTLRFVPRNGIWLENIVIDTHPSRISVYDNFKYRLTGRAVDSYPPLTITRPWIKTPGQAHVDDYGFADYIKDHLAEEDQHALTA